MLVQSNNPEQPSPRENWDRPGTVVRLEDIGRSRPSALLVRVGPADGHA